MFEKVKDRCLDRICASIPIGVWQQIRGTKVIVPYWHLVSDYEAPHVSGLGRRYRNIRQFKADLDFFLQLYSPVTERDIICHLHGGKALPPRSILFTFDDGFRESHDIIAPLLQASGAPATFFLTTASIDNRELCYTQKKSLLIEALARIQSPAVLGEITRVLALTSARLDSPLTSQILAVSYGDRTVLDDIARVLQVDFRGYLDSRKPYLSSQQVKALLHQGFAVGAHSIDHPLYAELSLDDQLNQTRQSIRAISDRFQIQCQSFAFPYHANGVSPDFFRSILAEGEVQVCFGTGGVIQHQCQYMLSRFTPELSQATAAETLARAFCRGLFG